MKEIIMKYILALIALLVSFTAAADVKYLHYKFNHNVIITISNVECPIPKIKDQYDWAVVATRIDGEKLIGCYKKENEDNIRIQWYKGDVTVLPANAFLVNPELGDKAKPDTSEKTAI
jgi:hypothetical protein